MGDKMKTRLIVTVLFLIPLSSFVYTEGFADDVSKGRDYFLSQCIACHAFSCNRKTDYANSPKLGGLIGRKAGGVEDFPDYTEGFKNSEIIWNDKTLDEFFKDPGKIDPNSLMVENGKIDNAEVRKQIIAFLKTEDPTINLFCPK
jgi:cytochrome c2